MSDSNEVREAAERLRLWEAASNTQQRYRAYDSVPHVNGDLTRLNMAHQRDLRVVTRAYLAHSPITRERVAAAVGELFKAYGVPNWPYGTATDLLCRLLGVEQHHDL